MKMSLKNKVPEVSSTMTNEQDSFTFEVIANIDSPYKEKFAIPRQPNLVSAAKGKVVLTNKANNNELVRDIEQFSHLWLLFVFHGTQEQGWKPLVRPPRLGGNTKTGVLATRSTFRPNPIGMSVVKLDKVTTDNKQVILHISGLDLLDGTPILDIKPYVPYSDVIPNANGGFAHEQPDKNISIVLTEQARSELAIFIKQYDELELLIQQVLEQDPRPAYKQGKPDSKVYGMCLYDLNIQWQFITLNTIEVASISQVK